MPNIYSTHGFWEELPKFYTCGIHCDVVFHCFGGQLLKAHRLVLSSWSFLLQSLFEEQRHRDVVEISVPHIQKQCLDNILRFLYEGSIRMNENEVEEFYKCKEALSLKFSHVCVTDSGEEVMIMNNDQNGTVFQQNTPERVQVINKINSMLGSFSKTPEKDQKGKEEKKVRPVLVPLKHFQAAVRFVEKRKAEKKIETMVEEAVRKRMKCFHRYFKEDRTKQRKNENHQGQILPNALTSSSAAQYSKNHVNNTSRLKEKILK